MHVGNKITRKVYVQHTTHAHTNAYTHISYRNQKERAVNKPEVHRRRHRHRKRVANGESYHPQK